MAATCTVLTPPYEDVKDWRRSLRLAVEGMRSQLRQERERGSTASYECDGEVFFVARLDDEDLERVAYSYAVRQVEQAIRQQESEEITNRVKRRAGQAA